MKINYTVYTKEWHAAEIEVPKELETQYLAGEITEDDLISWAEDNDLDYHEVDWLSGDCEEIKPDFRGAYILD